MSRAILALALCLAALLVPASASGVWGGSLDPDDPATGHPQVGAMYYDYPRDDVDLVGAGPLVDGLVCSGSYAGPARDGVHDVFLLAGHCLPSPADGIEPDDLYVSFSNNESVTDTHTPITGAIQVDEYVQMPGFGHDSGDLHDLAVLLIPKQTGLTPVRLAPVGYLDALKRQKQLDGRRITIVGYGYTPEWEPAGPTTFAFDGKRNAGESVINGLGKAFVKFQQNNGIGTGQGLCFGDSGSPQIDETNRSNPLVISVSSGGNSQCNSINHNYRVDTPQARGFLSLYLP